VASPRVKSALVFTPTRTLTPTSLSRRSGRGGFTPFSPRSGEKGRI
jgi:hypothetical protein